MICLNDAGAQVITLTLQQPSECPESSLKMVGSEIRKSYSVMPKNMGDNESRPAEVRGQITTAQIGLFQHTVFSGN